MSDNLDLLVKLGVSALAVWAFIIPEPASSVTGFVVLGGVWGLGLFDEGGA